MPPRPPISTSGPSTNPNLTKDFNNETGFNDVDFSQIDFWELYHQSLEKLRVANKEAHQAYLDQCDLLTSANTNRADAAQNALAILSKAHAANASSGFGGLEFTALLIGFITLCVALPLVLPGAAALAAPVIAVGAVTLYAAVRKGLEVSRENKFQESAERILNSAQAKPLPNQETFVRNFTKQYRADIFKMLEMARDAVRNGKNLSVNRNNNPERPINMERHYNAPEVNNDASRARSNSDAFNPRERSGSTSSKNLNFSINQKAENNKFLLEIATILNKLNGGAFAIEGFATPLFNIANFRKEILQACNNFPKAEYEILALVDNFANAQNKPHIATYQGNFDNYLYAFYAALEAGLDKEGRACIQAMQHAFNTHFKNNDPIIYEKQNGNIAYANGVLSILNGVENAGSAGKKKGELDKINTDLRSLELAADPVVVNGVRTLAGKSWQAVSFSEPHFEALKASLLQDGIKIHEEPITAEQRLLKINDTYNKVLQPNLAQKKASDEKLLDQLDKAKKHVDTLQRILSSSTDDLETIRNKFIRVAPLEGEEFQKLNESINIIKSDFSSLPSDFETILLPSAKEALNKGMVAFGSGKLSINEKFTEAPKRISNEYARMTAQALGIEVGISAQPSGTLKEVSPVVDIVYGVRPGVHSAIQMVMAPTVELEPGEKPKDGKSKPPINNDLKALHSAIAERIIQKDGKPEISKKYEVEFAKLDKNRELQNHITGLVTGAPTIKDNHSAYFDALRNIADSAESTPKFIEGVKTIYERFAEQNKGEFINMIG